VRFFAVLPGDAVELLVQCPVMMFMLALLARFCTFHFKKLMPSSWTLILKPLDKQGPCNRLEINPPRMKYPAASIWGCVISQRIFKACQKKSIPSTPLLLHNSHDRIKPKALISEGGMPSSIGFKDIQWNMVGGGCTSSRTPIIMIQ